VVAGQKPPMAPLFLKTIIILTARARMPAATCPISQFLCPIRPAAPENPCYHWADQLRVTAEETVTQGLVRVTGINGDYLCV
jgi:hypothetical protein